MNSWTYRRLEDLRQAIENDPRTLALREAEKKLQEDPEVFALFQKTQGFRGDYLAKRLELGEDDPATKEALKTFHKSKLLLDENPLAMEYSKRYQAVSWLYREIDGILFSAFREERRCGHD